MVCDVRIVAPEEPHPNEYVESPLREVVVIGGGTSVEVAMTIRASVFNQPITVVSDLEVVALGAARLAAQAVGLEISFR